MKHKSTHPEINSPHSRRDFFARASDGLLGAAFTWLFSKEMFGGPSAFAEDAEHESSELRQVYDLKPRRPHHEPKARSVIQLFMNGGPSQMDLFDPKPHLNNLDGKPFPGNVEEIGNQGTDDIGVMMGGRYKFARHGES
ncbi:MAG: DUF1501 domain-containing protein, partial [Planctomycetaceae bacterium]|nr:DUF1501 domain-containing protein [Planctomycetaceae bacterium]